MTLAPVPGTIMAGDHRVDTLLLAPHGVRAMLVLAHGAGAGMAHPFLERLARVLAERSIGTFRYQFPYMQNRTGRPDSPAVARGTVRAACAAARHAYPDLPLFAGGKSFGGRMTSGAQAESPLEGVRGIVFVGFPLHAPKKPATERARHLDRVDLPMLFLQGTRDDLADLTLIRDVTTRLGPRATLHVVEGANHSFAVLKRSGRTSDDVFAELGEAIAGFVG